MTPELTFMLWSTALLFVQIVISAASNVRAMGQPWGIGNREVAAELNLHPRTLHRRLAAEGTSFQKIKDEVRRDVMLYYLQQTRLDFTRISERLGFSEQSVMTRRCNRWFSASPTRVRAGKMSQSVKR